MAKKDTKKKKEEQPFSEDTVFLLRSIFKMSVAINDLDDIAYEKKYYKFDFKRKANKWYQIFPLLTNPTIKALMEANEDLLNAYYQAFNDNGISVTATNKEQRSSLIMFYVKMRSSINDLKCMNVENSMIHGPILLEYASDLISQLESQYPDIKDLKDESGRSINFLIDYYDDYGRLAMAMPSGK